MSARKVFNVIIFAGIICVSAAVIFPVIFTVINSFSSNGRGYFEFFIGNPLYLRSFLNSSLIAGFVSIFSVAVAAFSSYVFAKVDFKGRTFLFYLYIIVMMMPFQVTLLPQYILSKKLFLYDTPFALILPGIFHPFSVFLLTQIIKTIPNDMIEAARLETNSTFIIIIKIIIPQVRAGIFCLITLNFAEYWNMVAEPIVLMETESKLPLSVIIPEMSLTNGLGAAAASVIFLVPPFLLYLFFKKEIIKGLSGYKLE